MSDPITERRLRIISAVQTIVNESGNPIGFDAASWVDDWLSHSLPALGGQLPAEYLTSDEGCQTLIGLLRQVQPGAAA